MAKKKTSARAASAEPELTKGEWVIIKVVWDLEPVTAPTVQEALIEQTGWTYSTVKTVMDRMVYKGLLATERIRNLILYRAAITRAQARRGEILRTVQHAFDGEIGPMMQFLLERSDLSNTELAEMEQLIQQRRSSK